ncbi:MAG TPA: type II secretion system F family protein [Acidimicrobiales bacterium]|jgi:tight adherence protein B|nr:type II secretion system F family protein [Acidimicrobiales bacterium]
MILAIDLVVLGFAAVTAAATSVAVIVVVSVAGQRASDPATAAGPSRSQRRLDDAFDASPVLRRAIELTANLAERRGALGSVERSLRAADIPIRPAEAIFAYVLLAVLVPVVSLLLGRSTELVVLALLVFVVLPPMALRFVVKRRRKKFVSQLPDALTTLAGSLRAGRSLGQALEALAREMPAPMGRELRKIVAEIRLGRPMADALDDAVERVGSPDFRWAVLAIQIQAEVGGNLAELLGRVAETMRARSRLRGEVRALTAEGRASAGMLVVLPPALGGVMYLVNPHYMQPMFTQTGGHIMLAVSAVMIVAGFAWMKKVVTIDV